MTDQTQAGHEGSHDAGYAALAWVAMLSATLVQKNIISVAESRDITAKAASSCHKAGREKAAQMLEAFYP